MKKEIITTLNAPAPWGLIIRLLKSGNTLYISGQIPIMLKQWNFLAEPLKRKLN